jgi:hypothetical protein
MPARNAALSPAELQKILDANTRDGTKIKRICEELLFLPEAPEPEGVESTAGTATGEDVVEQPVVESRAPAEEVDAGLNEIYKIITRMDNRSGKRDPSKRK